MKKLLVTLLIALVSLSLIGCFGEVTGSPSTSEKESESESEPEKKTWIVTIVYQRVYNGPTYTQTIEVEEGVKTTITLPSIAVDPNADYEFSGWKIVETGVTYGASTTTIEVTCTSNITIKSQLVKVWAGPY